jgi:hypothetical protein
MPAPPIAFEDAMAAVRLVAEIMREPGYYYGQRRAGQRSAAMEAARRMGVADSTFTTRLNSAQRCYGLCPKTYSFEATPIDADDDEIPDGRAVLDRHKQANFDYIANVIRTQRAKMFVVPKEPFGVAFFGDPHLDNKGSDLKALERDVEAVAAARLRSVNIGDLLDNFHHRGRLASKQAQNRMSEKEGLAVSRWFLRDAGVPWDAHLLGNHDEWAGTAHGTLMQEWAGRVKVFNWMGRLIYNWGDGQVSVLAAHDFKGHSQFNPLHALAKRALEDGQDDLYVAGHRHNAADGGWENGFRDKHYKMLRLRGYKRVDEFAYSKGFSEQTEGASGVAVIDPFAATMSGRIRLYQSIPEGIEHVNYLRNLRTT